MFGFDAIYQQEHTEQQDHTELQDHTKSSIIETAVSSNRILLTRNKELLREKTITRGYLIRAVDPMEQIAEVMSRFDLFSLVNISRVSHSK